MENTIKDIEMALVTALRLTLHDLYQDYPTEDFYYFVLSTTGEGLCPSHAIWSERLLDQEAQRQAPECGCDVESMKAMLRFSAADSPLFERYQHHFQAVNQLFLSRPCIDDLSDSEWQTEFDLRINAMLNALKTVAEAQCFGVGEQRARWFINVEVISPDESNLSRALQLNSKEKVEAWLDLGGE